VTEYKQPEEEWSPASKLWTAYNYQEARKFYVVVSATNSRELGKRRTIDDIERQQYEKAARIDAAQQVSLKPNFLGVD
jgi:hypothetical protein